MILPHFSFEKKALKEGFKTIAGIDEVGRGAFAGPVVAGCVVFRRDIYKSFKQGVGVKINDSKKLTPKAREKASMWIKDNAVAWGIGEAPVTVVNRLGIVKASQMAFRRAVEDANKKIGTKIDFLLIDAFYAPYVKGLRRKNQKAIIKGDTKSISIAAASIVAKVYRDHLMEKLGRTRKYKKYGWDKNKGYGTASHRTAIKKHGRTRLHRKLFIESTLKED